MRYRVATTTDIPTGEGREYVAGGRIVALYNVNGSFHALDGICPHAGGPLAKGALSGNVVTCPWHGWQFDVTSGQHCLNAQLKHACFSVFVEGTDLIVELPDQNT